MSHSVQDNLYDGTITYEYDNTTTGGAYAKGRLTKVTDAAGFTTYVYDALGRVTSKTQTTNATPASKSFTVGYTYGNGRLTGITYPSANAVTYGFDSQGQVSSITVGTTTVLAGATYVPFGPVSGWTWGNGEVMSRGYDTDGRVASLTTGPASATYADLSQVYGYDALNRLNSANLAAGQTQSFTYDANGNRTNATINAASTTYTYPTTSHRLSSLSGATSRSFAYDNAGNLTASAGITYVYDGRGRMKQAATTTYLVNGLGQRVKKTTAAVDTHFVYDEAGHLIGEYDSSGTLIEETIWLGDLPVAVMKPASPGGVAIYYVWADHLGTPRLITDAANQSRWEWPNADPFGNNLPNENPANLGSFAYNLRFPGQYFDSETGKHYNYFRDYDPATGRYVESDPVGLRAGLNTYTYVYDSPLLFTDVLGLDIKVCLFPSMANGAGHVGFGTTTESGTFGFYPKPGSGGPGGIGMIVPGLTPGVVKPDPNPGTTGGSCKVIKSTPDDDDCMKRCRARREKDPGSYDLESRQCTSFARDCLAECKLPSGQGYTPFPRRWFNSLPGSAK